MSLRICCEDWLCLSASSPDRFGYAASLADVEWLRRREGVAQTINCHDYGKAQPFLTTGGKAKYLFEVSGVAFSELCLKTFD
jgi:hypothetical protein